MKALILLVFLSGVGLLFGQSGNDAASEPRFSELSRQESERLNQQRGIIAAVAKQRYGITLSKTKGDLPVLQRLIDDKVFKKSQTYELQSLGIVFGDVLASELSLRWVTISDEYGTDPTLRFKNTRININVLTMISKRLERDESVNLSRLLQQNREALSGAEKRFR